MLPTVAGRFFPKAALNYSKLRPNIVIRTKTGPYVYLRDCLRAGAIDLMVGRMPASSEMLGLSFLAAAHHLRSVRPSDEPRLFDR